MATSQNDHAKQTLSKRSLTDKLPFVNYYESIGYDTLGVWHSADTALRCEAGGNESRGRQDDKQPFRVNSDEELRSRDGPVARRVRQRLAEQLGCCDEPDCCDSSRAYRDVLGGSRECYCVRDDRPRGPVTWKTPPPSRHQTSCSETVVDKSRGSDRYVDKNQEVPITRDLLRELEEVRHLEEKLQDQQKRLAEKRRRLEVQYKTQDDPRRTAGEAKTLRRPLPTPARLLIDDRSRTTPATAATTKAENAYQCRARTARRCDDC